MLDTVSELLASSLLATSEDADPEPRLYMLQTVRAYAAEKLAASPDRAETERRHTEWVLNMLAEQLRVRGREHRRLFERLDHERANLRAVVSRAIQAGDVATIAQLARDALPYLAHRDREVEVVGWLDQALSQAEAAPPALRGRLLVLRALVATVFADFTKARSLLTAGRALLPNDDDHAYDRALATMADAYTAVADDPQRAPTAIDAAAEQFAALGIGLGRAYMEVTRGNLALHHGEMEKAAASYQTAVQLADDLGDNAMRGRALSLLGLTRLALGDVDGARVSVVHGARANRHGAQPTSMAYSLDGLAAIALASGRSAVAVRALSSAAAVRAQSGHPPSPAFSALLADLASRGREQLGTMAYAAAWSEAQEWKVEEALDRTLQGLEEPA